MFFTSYQELLPGVTGDNLYRFDFGAPEGQRLELVSKALSGSGGVSAGSIASGNGQRVYFTATGVLTEAPNIYGKTAEAGLENLYMWEEAREGRAAHTAYIGAADVELATSGNAQTTANGEFLVFRSYADLTPGDESSGYPAYQAFEYDGATGALVRVSVGQNGFNNDGNTNTDEAARPFVSEDGRRVFFQTSDGLTPGALNDQTNTDKNIYEYTWQGSQPSEAMGQVYLISDGVGTSAIPPTGTEFGSYLVGIDTEGENVFFRTADDLVPQDATTQTVIYDARVNGGFPGLPQPSNCEASACQGEVPLAPALAAPSSANQPPGGNLAAVIARPTKPVNVRVKVLRNRVHDMTIWLKVKVPAKGSVVAYGAGLRTTKIRASHAGTYRLRVKLSPRAAASVRRQRKHGLRHKRKLTVRVRFVPAHGKASQVSVLAMVKA